MRILYGIQGTGNGHLSRALEFIPILQKRAEVDILISGTQVELAIPYPIKYRFKGLGFIFGKKGGVDIFSTFWNNDTRRLLSEIRTVPMRDYDLVINDFEPVSAWAAYFANKPCAALSNQCAVLSPKAPRPAVKDTLGKLILKYYAPSTMQYGLHFKRFDNNIYTPVIRQEIRQLEPTDKGHYTVYLPAHEDERIIKHLRRYDVNWDVFSKHTKTAYRVKNINIQPIESKAFAKSLASCSGILSAAGFGTTAEALFLQKKLLVIPMKTQYEQHCNAAVLESMGVPAMKKLKKKHTGILEKWLDKGKPVTVDYPDLSEEIIDRILGDYQHMSAAASQAKPELPIPLALAV
jgi:uncharacterized protein (TIGR00661 family)